MWKSSWFDSDWGRILASLCGSETDSEPGFGLKTFVSGRGMFPLQWELRSSETRRLHCSCLEVPKPVPTGVAGTQLALIPHRGLASEGTESTTPSAAVRVPSGFLYWEIVYPKTSQGRWRGIEARIFRGTSKDQGAGFGMLCKTDPAQVVSPNVGRHRILEGRPSFDSWQVGPTTSWMKSESRPREPRTALCHSSGTLS